MRLQMISAREINTTGKLLIKNAIVARYFIGKGDEIYVKNSVNLRGTRLIRYLKVTEVLAT